MAHVNWLELTPEEFIDRRAAHPVCYMPYGLAECHGVYNSMGVDWNSAISISTAAAHKHGGIVAPHSAWHIDESPEFNWSVRGNNMGEMIGAGLPPFMFYHILLYHLRAMDARKFKVALFVTGHAVSGAPYEVGLLVDYYKRITGSPIQAEWVSYFSLFEKDAFPQASRDHAGDMETAISYAAFPEHAPLHLLGTEARYPEIGGGNEHRTSYNAPRAFVNDASRGEELMKMGHEMIDYVSDKLAAKAQQMLDAYVEPEVRPEAPNYYATEAIWAAFEKITARYWQTNKTFGEYLEHQEHPQFPGWDWFLK